MRAYLTEGELISDHPTLRRLALEVGLPAVPVDELLAGERYAEEVRTDEYTASRLGITAVPFFVVDRTFGAAGAQSPEHISWSCFAAAGRRAPRCRSAAGARRALRYRGLLSSAGSLPRCHGFQRAERLPDQPGQVLLLASR